MTRDDIIRLAREAGYPDYAMGLASEDAWQKTERFAALVAAEKEQQMTRDGWRQCAKGQRTTQFCGLLDAAVKAEREACARMVDHILKEGGGTYGKAIRARGEV
jgi:hypothetical protein